MLFDTNPTAIQSLAEIEFKLVKGDAVYTGQHRDKLPQGRGTLKWDDYDLSGFWHAGKLIQRDPSNQNQEANISAKVWSNGQVYIGEFAHDHPHGQGLMGFNDGQFYEGSLQFGLYHGEGKLTMSNDEVRPGPWFHGVRKLQKPQNRKQNLFHEHMVQSDMEAQNKFTPHNASQIDQCLSIKTKQKGMVVTLNSINCVVKHVQRKNDPMPSCDQPIMPHQEMRQQKMTTTFHLLQKCQRCNCQCGPYHDAYKSNVAENANKWSDSIVCNRCTFRENLKPGGLKMMQIPENHNFYQEFTFSESSGSLLTCEKQPSDESRFEVSFWSENQAKLEQVHKFEIQHPVLLDFSSRNHNQIEALFLDQKGDNLMWFSFQNQQLFLNSLDLKQTTCTGSSVNLPQIQKKEILGQLKESLLISLNLKQELSGNRQIIQWPDVMENFVLIKGLNVEGGRYTLKQSLKIFDINKPDFCLLQRDGLQFNLHAKFSENQIKLFSLEYDHKSGEKSLQLVVDNYEITGTSKLIGQQKVKFTKPSDGPQIAKNLIIELTSQYQLGIPKVIVSNSEEKTSFNLICKNGQWSFDHSESKQETELARVGVIQNASSGHLGGNLYIFNIAQDQIQKKKGEEESKEERLWEFNLFEFNSNQPKLAGKYQFKLPSDINYDINDWSPTSIVGVQVNTDSFALLIMTSNQEICLTEAKQQIINQSQELATPTKVKFDTLIFQQVYPLLVYGSKNSNELWVSNSAKNVVQTKIQMGPYKLECFVQTGIQRNGPGDDKDGLTTFVYFLARNDQQIALLRLVSQALHDDYMGKIEVINQNVGFKPQSQEKIEQAVLFQSVKYSHLTADNLILRISTLQQTDQEVRVISMMQNEKKPKDIIEKTYQKLVVGAFNQLFLIRKSSKDNKCYIKCVVQNDDLDIEVITLFTHDCFIETLQMLDPIDLPLQDSELKMTLAMIDQKLDFHRLSYEKEPELNLTVIEQPGNPRSLELSQRFMKLRDQNISTSDCILNRVSITMPIKNNSLLQGQEVHINTGMSFPIETYRIPQRGNSLGRLIEMQSSDWAFRKVARLNQGKLTYFQISKQGETRNLNLFSAKDQRSFATQTNKTFEYQVTNSKIVVISYHYCMVFDRQTLMLQHITFSASDWTTRIVHSHNQDHVILFVWGKVAGSDLLVHREGNLKPQVLQNKAYQFFQIIKQETATDIVLTPDGELALFVMKPKGLGQADLSFNDQQPSQRRNKITARMVDSPLEEVFDYSIQMGLKDEFSEFTVLQTNNFIVVRFGKERLFYFKCSIGNIPRRNKKYRLTLIDSHNWFQYDQVFELGIRIDYTKQNNCLIKGRSDVIQISTTEHALLFDLKQYREVNHILNYRLLCENTEAFTDPGIILYYLRDEEEKFFTLYKASNNIKATRMLSSRDSQIFIKPVRHERQIGNCFSEYSQYELREANRFLNQNHRLDYENNIYDKNINLVKVGGYSLLETFSRWGDSGRLTQMRKALKKIFKQIKEADFEELKRLQDPVFEKRLRQSMNFVKTLKIRNHYTNIQQPKYVYPRLTNWIGLMLLSKDANINDLIQDYPKFRDLTDIQLPKTNKFFRHRFAITPWTRQIKNFQMEKTKDQLVFTSNTACLSSDQIKEYAEKQMISSRFSNLLFLLRLMQGRQTFKVQVMIYDINWLNNGSDQLFDHIAVHNDEKLIKNPMIYAILKKSNYFHVILPHFLSYVCQMIFTIIHHMYILQNGYTEDWMKYITVLALFFTWLQVWHEMRQYKFYGDKIKLGPAEEIIPDIIKALIRLTIYSWTYPYYLLMPFNAYQVFTFSVNLHCIVKGLTMSTEELMDPNQIGITVVWPSIGAFCLVLQLLYWMTIFPGTSFYIYLLVQSFKDLIPFLSVLFIILAAFSVGVLVITMNHATHHQELFELDEGEDVIINRFNDMFVDGLFSQWLLGLGQFEMLGLSPDGNLEQVVKTVLYIYFFVATLLTQIIMFNTLVAILGDSFTRMTEKSQMYAFQSRAEIYIDFMYDIKQQGFNKFTSDAFMYVLRRAEDDDEKDDNWDSTMGNIKRNIDGVQKVQRSQQDRIATDLIKVREKMKADRVYMEKKVDRMQTVILESLNDN